MLEDRNMETRYRTDEEIHALVSAFEACTFHPSEFRHYQHLTVALWYVWHLTPEEATLRMTTGIRRLAETYGRMGYHETITLFWLRMVSNFAAGYRKRSLAETANSLIENYNDKNLIGEFYSAELLATAKAKAEWAEPDLKPLPHGAAAAHIAVI